VTRREVYRPAGSAYRQGDAALGGRKEMKAD
jgi:hypothetical protein